MRENCTHGSEGGEAQAFPTPIRPSTSSLAPPGNPARRLCLPSGSGEAEPRGRIPGQSPGTSVTRLGAASRRDRLARAPCRGQRALPRERLASRPNHSAAAPIARRHLCSRGICPGPPANPAKSTGGAGAATRRQRASLAPPRPRRGPRPHAARAVPAHPGVVEAGAPDGQGAGAWLAWRMAAGRRRRAERARSARPPRGGDTV